MLLAVKHTADDSLFPAKQQHTGGQYNLIAVAYNNKKLSYRRGTARCLVSIKILPVATQQCRNNNNNNNNKQICIAP